MKGYLTKFGCLTKYLFFICSMASSFAFADTYSGDYYPGTGNSSGSSSSGGYVGGGGCGYCTGGGPGPSLPNPVKTCSFLTYNNGFIDNEDLFDTFLGTEVFRYAVPEQRSEYIRPLLLEKCGFDAAPRVQAVQYRSEDPKYGRISFYLLADGQYVLRDAVFSRLQKSPLLVEALLESKQNGGTEIKFP
jgi:hypothetical protein